MRVSATRLNQLRPAAGVDTLAYPTGPVRIDTEITRLVICNTGAATTIRVYQVPDGDTPSADNALYFDFPIAGNDSIKCDAESEGAGFTLRENDNFFVQSASGEVSFTLYGMSRTITGEVVGVTHA